MFSSSHSQTRWCFCKNPSMPNQKGCAFPQSPPKRTEVHAPCVHLSNRLVISMLGSIIPPGYPCHGIMAMRLNLVPFFDFCQLSTSICPHLDGRHGSCAPSDTLALRCQNLICGWVCCQKNCVYIYIQCIIYIYNNIFIYYNYIYIYMSYILMICNVNMSTYVYIYIYN